MAAGVYLISNCESAAVYIGSTTNFNQRWRSHKSQLCRGVHQNPHLQASWDYYGEDAFEFSILEYIDDPEELHIVEQEWMDWYRGEGYELYNCGLVARNPMLGNHHTKEARRKISEAMRGEKNPNYGRVVSEETRRKISEANTGHRLGQAAKHWLSQRWLGKKNLNYGKPLSEKVKQKLGEANAGMYPALVNRETGEVIPAGRNLNALCRRRGLNPGHMWSVINGKRPHHWGWQIERGGL